jgi:hypothetical protein
LKGNYPGAIIGLAETAWFRSLGLHLGSENPADYSTGGVRSLSRVSRTTMKRISGLEQDIRSKVNNCGLYDRFYKNDLDAWNALCVAMDTLGDTCSALDEYEASGFGKNLGEQYLRMYGFFQSIFLQQDSIRQLHNTFVHSDLRTNAESAWQQLRDIRNLTVGHPIEKNSRGEIERCFISQTMIKSGSLQLLVWVKSENTDRIQDVDIASLYGEYKSEAISYLDEVGRSIK